MGKAFYSVSLGVTLALLWLTLSGRVTDVLVLSLGAVSILIAIVLTERFGILDGETSSFHRLWMLIPYWIWLFIEIVKANIAVTRTVVSADLDITPRLVSVPADTKTEFARTVFANSITLTPGTVTVQAGDNTLLVHALLGEMADPKGFAEMQERSVRASERRAS